MSLFSCLSQLSDSLNCGLANVCKLFRAGVDGLIPDAWRPLGLSNAQRDLCTQLYLQSLIMWGSKQALREAKRLLAARQAAGKDASLTQRLQAALVKARL